VREAMRQRHQQMNDYYESRVLCRSVYHLQVTLARIRIVRGVQDHHQPSRSDDSG
jgi:hypothetical protein